MSVIDEPGFLARTRRKLTRSADAALGKLIHRYSPDLPTKDVRRLVDEITATVDPSIGEMTARRRAAEIGDRYRQFDATGRRRFFALLAEEFGVDRSTLDDSIAARRLALETQPVNQHAVIEAERKIRQALVSPREILFRRFNGFDDGVKFVVDLRSDLREFRSDDAEWKGMDAELRDLLGSWFDVGNLELRRISWDTPASLLEKLIAYESVHAITSWNDLKNRLDSDRRCYAFFHAGMPDEPLIFVEVALVVGLADDLAELLDLDAPQLDPAAADTAIFYSISNCQTGLAGVNLGDLLIKRVVTALLADLPDLKTFSTLSPIPGFGAWLTEQLDTGVNPFSLEERENLATLLDTTDVPASVLAVLDRPDWHADTQLADGLSAPLLRVCRTYLTEQRRGKRTLDRVANFHLSNGARIEQLNWLANTSPVGLERSAGIMVNYRYVPDYISGNHDAYVSRGEIHVSPTIRALGSDS